MPKREILRTNEADHIELDLAIGCDHDADDDERNVAQRLQARRCKTEDPCGKKRGDNVGSLRVVRPGPPSRIAILTFSIWINDTLKYM